MNSHLNSKKHAEKAAALAEYEENKTPSVNQSSTTASTSSTTTTTTTTTVAAAADAGIVEKSFEEMTDVRKQIERQKERVIIFSIFLGRKS